MENKIKQKHLFAEEVPSLLWVTNRPCCERFSLELLEAGELFGVRRVTDPGK